MIKERRNGTCYIYSERGTEYINAFNAVAAATSLELHLAMLGYLVTSNLNIENNSISVCCHFEGKPLPALPYGYTATSWDITSHEYYCKYEWKMTRVRCKTFYFKFKKQSNEQ